MTLGSDDLAQTLLGAPRGIPFFTPAGLSVRGIRDCEFSETTRSGDTVTRRVAQTIITGTGANDSDFSARITGGSGVVTTGSGEIRATRPGSVTLRAVAQGITKLNVDRSRPCGGMSAEIGELESGQVTVNVFGVDDIKYSVRDGGRIFGSGDGPFDLFIGSGRLQLQNPEVTLTNRETTRTMGSELGVTV